MQPREVRSQEHQLGKEYFRSCFGRHRLGPRDAGQTTAEYALVLLAAGTIAMLVITWARGENSIDELFDLVVTKITTSVE